jgi:hypothetical protein
VATSSSDQQNSGGTSTSVDKPVSGSGGDEKHEKYDAQKVAEDPSRAPEEANQGRVPQDPRPSDEQQPPTKTQY